MDRSGVCDDLERRLTGPGGRPRQLPVRTLAAAIIAMSLDGKPEYLTEVYLWLLRLEPELRLALGVDVVRADGSRKHLSYRQVEYLYNRTLQLMDSSPVRRRRRDESIEDWQKRTKAAASTGSRARELDDRLNRFTDLILGASTPDDMQAHPHHAVDATDVEAWTRRTKEERLRDSNAKYLRRPSDGPGEKDDIYVGYRKVTAVTVRADDGPPVPEYCVSLRITTEDEAPTSLEMFEDMKDRGVPTGDVLADSKYPYAIGWSQAMRSMGYDLVVDLHTGDRGMQGTEQGALVVDGSLFCPKTPAELLALEALRNDTAKKPELEAMWAERERFRFSTKGRADEDGYQRYQCPAATGKIRCPLMPDSMARSADRPTVLNPPATPPTCCTQLSITAPPSVAPKTRQKHPYGSQSWQTSFNRRTAVERDNGRNEDAAIVDLSRGRIRVQGRAKTQFFHALAQAATNIQMHEAFGSDQPRHERAAAAILGTTRPPRSRARRRTETFRDLVAPRTSHPASGP